MINNINRLKLYFYLAFVLFVFFSFIFVPKERARKNTKEAKIVDYVLFSTENLKTVQTVPPSLYYPNEKLTYDQWLNKNSVYNEMLHSLENNTKSTQFNYDSYDKYLEEKNISQYKQNKPIIRYKPYYKIRYDIIARNIILFGSLLSGIFIVIRIKQIKI